MPKNILLADDSITIQKVVELTFSDGDYEVTAVNNGAKAIQKLAEMRPDIILSDIIMPEKNGYEVCEYVKSHPEYRSIPVVLLTGTFEPFDPDRAEKAGCDAVVTKPFESQSLIHKVEELIAQARTDARSAATTEVAPIPTPPPPPEPEPEPEPSPWLDEAPSITPPPPVAAPPLFTTSGGSVPAPPEAFTHDADIFNAPPQSGGSADMPFETPADTPVDTPFGAPPEPEAFSGETRAFPQINFDDLQQMSTATELPLASDAPSAADVPSASEPPSAEEPPPAPEPSPWDEPADFAGETRAFGKMSFDELQQMAGASSAPMPEYEPEPPAPMPEPEMESPFGAPQDAPFGAPPSADEFSGETRAFPRMTFDEIQQFEAQQSQPAPAYEPEPEPPAPEPAPWDEQPAAAADFGPETRAVPQLQVEPPPPPAPEPSPWDEQPEEPMFGGETRAFPKMSFDELQQLASAAPEPEQEPAPWEQPSEPAWAPEEETPLEVEASAPPVLEELPMAEPEAIAEAEEPPVPSPALAPEATPAIPIAAHELTDEQVDRIARRVIELMSDQVIRNIAWEVIPDLAEMVVKERIRQLESEA